MKNWHFTGEQITYALRRERGAQNPGGCASLKRRIGNASSSWPISLLDQHMLQEVIRKTL
jgi:hypothetical protein